MAVTVNGAICCGQLAMSLMQTFFMFYYVKVFWNIYKIDQFWFGLSQMLFVVWNAINDPTTWFHCRTKVISYLAPFLAISFLIFWFPWYDIEKPSQPYIVGYHLIVALFLYDSFFSCVNVSWSALFAETTCNRSERISALKFSQFAILISVNIIPITEKLTDGLDKFRIFQCISVILAMLALICFKITGSLKYRKSTYDEVNSPKPLREKSATKIAFALKTTAQILTNGDFRIIAFTYFLHSCRSTIHLNFASIATELLVPENVMEKGSWEMSIFYAACTLGPQLLVVLSGDLIVRIGAASVITKSLIGSVISSFSLMMFGYSRPYLIILFMLFDSITVHSIAPLYQVLLAEYIEDDMTHFARQ
ncbi:unnamed protein product [Thelazia callipaeda]|uniref:Major facilitator superfamily protein n=1 Tax=Thelazia callipaeda TaxID=103827 RepID=A0A0N5D5Z0_THECL|nr:unnamed protein product [Thelazia callipaeda]